MSHGPFLTSVEPEHRDRFSKAIEQSALDSLLIVTLLLAACFFGEAITRFTVASDRHFLLPLALCTLNAAVAFARWRGRFRTMHAAWWQLCLLIIAFAYTLLKVGSVPLPQLIALMCLEMLGICFFIPVAHVCAMGASIVGLAIMLLVAADSSSNFTELGIFLIPTYALAFFAAWGRQRAIRRVVTSQIRSSLVSQELRLSKLALENTSHYVVWFDESGRIGYANQSLCAALNYTNEELRQKHIHQVSPNWTSDYWNLFVDQLIGQGADRRGMTLRTKGGEDIVVEIQFDLVESQDQWMICGVAFDLAERRLIEDEIQRVQHLEGLGTLAGGVAHDYNNLLVPIMMNANMILRGLPDGHPARQSVEDIVIAGERAANLTRQLLVYTGIETVEKKLMHLGEEISSIASLIRSSLPKGVTLEIETNIEIPYVLAEAAKIHQVLLNLVVNAGQSIEHNGRVQVRVGMRELTASQASRLDPPMQRPAGEYVTCEVNDTGCGMSSTTRQRMFDPFFTSKADGHGLGLSAVLGIMRIHRGGVVVDSTIGLGTMIRLYLPASHADKHEEEVRTSEPFNRIGDNKTALFVDDEELIRTTGIRALSQQGFHVLEAASGFEAVDILVGSAAKIDVVILDNRMPGLGLRETINRIRHAVPGIPIIASSGYPADVPKDVNGLVLLPKPYDVKTMLGLVKEVLENPPPKVFVSRRPHMMRRKNSSADIH